MLDYLNNYNISNEQIAIIEKNIKEKGVNIDIFKYAPEKIISILNLFKSIGVTNFYNIIITNPSMFRDTITSIKNRINKYPNKNELAKLLDEDITNLSLVGLLY